MTTTVELSIAGREDDDAPLLADLIEQIQDFFAMMNGVAASIAGDDVERFDWKVVGLSKNSPARVTVEAVARKGFKDGENAAREARDTLVAGLAEIRHSDVRPLHFTDNVIDAANRFSRRVTDRLAATVVGDGLGDLVIIRPSDAAIVVRNLTLLQTADPIHPYRELGSFEGYIQNVGTDGWQRPYVIIKSRITGSDVRCILSGDALRDLEKEPVANVVWRHRRVVAFGILKYRAVGKLSQADVERLDFADAKEALPQLVDIIDSEFTGGLSSQDYIERVRNGEA